jgi:hypothetical protein
MVKKNEHWKHVSYHCTDKHNSDGTCDHGSIELSMRMPRYTRKLQFIKVLVSKTLTLRLNLMFSISGHHHVML